MFSNRASSLALSLASLLVLTLASSSLAATEPNLEDERYWQYAESFISETNEILAEADELGWTLDYIEALTALNTQALIDIAEFDLSECIAQDRELLNSAVTASMVVLGYTTYYVTGDVGEPLDDADFDALFEQEAAAWDAYNEFNPATDCATGITVFEDGSSDTGMADIDFIVDHSKPLIVLAEKVADWPTNINKVPAYFKGVIKKANRALAVLNATEPQACWADEHRAMTKTVKNIKKAAQALLKNWNNNGSMGVWDRNTDRLFDNLDLLADSYVSVGDNCY